MEHYLAMRKNITIYYNIDAMERIMVNKMSKKKDKFLMILLM